LSKANQCVSCHSVTETRIGPPFRAVAARYAERPRALSVEVLAAKILAGGSGNWGVFPMPPRERFFSANEAREIAAAIIDLEPGK
jgi:cytochrome c